MHALAYHYYIMFSLLLIVYHLLLKSYISYHRSMILMLYFCIFC